MMKNDYRKNGPPVQEESWRKVRPNNDKDGIADQTAGLKSLAVSSLSRMTKEYTANAVPSGKESR